MSSLCQPLSADIADLFTELYDALGDEPFRSDEANEWLTRDRVVEIAADTEFVAVGGRLDAEAIADSIDVAEDQDERIFAHLLGLDRALSYVHPFTATADQAGLLEIAVRYVETGRLSTDHVEGALLPRFALHGRESVIREQRADAFSSVIRVSPEAWKLTDHRVIPNRFDFGRKDRERGIVVGAAPVFAEPSEMRWEVEERGVGRRFRIAPRSDLNLKSRFEVILQRLDERGAMVGVLPELTLTPELLALWQTVMRETPRESNLRWVFVGTGPFGDDLPAANRGYLLDRLTGEILLTQDKLFPFTLTGDQLRDWKLEHLLGDQPIAEDLLRGTAVTVAESSLGRLAILVCEDLSRVPALSNPLIEHGVSHALAPVFSKPTLAHHWEHSNAKVYAQAAGTIVVVANSLVIATLLGEEESGTSLAHGPGGYDLGWTDDADGVALLDLPASIPDHVPD